MSCIDLPSGASTRNHKSLVRLIAEPCGDPQEARRRA